MPTVAEVLTILTKREDLSDNDLADRTGVPQPTISRIKSGESRDPRDKTLRPLAKYFGVTVSQLRGDMPLSDSQSPHEPSNVAPGPPVRGAVPLISWVSAGAWRETIDSLETGMAEEWIETTAPVRQHTFALKVQGDSMEPDFPSGTYIVVEPDLDPQPGDFVIAKNGDEATFKQLTKDGADWYLKPLNPRYPIKPLESPCKIIGVVREAVRRFR